jgi:FtsP/CotA-like multicopper oxidase with cupredoxin domain
MTRTTTMTFQGKLMKLLSLGILATGALLVTEAATAAIPGITPLGDGSATPYSIGLTASADLTSQPDGAAIYSFGYGCTSASSVVKGFNSAATKGPAAKCPLMQVPGPTLILTEGTTVSVTLTNGLPKAAGNTSIIFTGFDVTTSGGAPTPGLRTTEAVNGGTVTYTFTAKKPGTYAYYSGSQSDLQIEMGLYGAVVVLPAPTAANLNYAAPTTCAVGSFALAKTAYDNDATCYDREYLFQFAEMDSFVHDQVSAQAAACAALPPANVCAPLTVTMEPYRANYFLINGRSMPDLMDTPFAVAYPHQPYNGNPQIHPGEKLLMRVIGQGRYQHPFHFHGNHARVLGRDGNLLVTDVTPTATSSLSGPLLFTIPTVSGQSVDAIFTWTGKGLNWDVYNHTAGDGSTCTPDANGFESTPGADNFGEWCADHNKPIPVTPPDPQIVANGQWYGGTPYIGLNFLNPVNLPPGTLNSNPGAGYAYMWHSHNEREITTNDIFPGGMMMMLIVDPPKWFIDETL